MLDLEWNNTKADLSHIYLRHFLESFGIYGPFAIERGETAKKFFFELMLFLDIFQYKNHIWHINKNFIFLAVSSLSIAKGPNAQIKYTKNAPEGGLACAKLLYHLIE